MATEVSDILERLLTNELVIAIDGIILIAQGTGLCFFLYGVLGWVQLMRLRSSTPMMSQLFNAPPSVNYIMALFFASALLWKFGEGIGFWGSLVWYGTEVDFNTPYSSAMYDDISQRSTNLVGLTTVGDYAENTQIAIRFGFAIFALFGVVSYFKGVLGITWLANPKMAGKITFGQIVVHMLFGILLVYSDLFYQSITNTATAAAMGA